MGAVIPDTFDYYVIRHGIRAPLFTSDPAAYKKYFGDAKVEELTGPGRSQCFYYGRELRVRHPYVKQN